jgi:pimeloyl-ACP methyl ester carboxylesterase
MPQLTVNGAVLSYLDEGAGVPLVFLHGVWMSGRFFERQRPFFRERCRTIVPDFRAHGRSEDVHEGHTVAQYARDVRSLLDAVDADDAILVGWSMGSLVIWELASQHGLDGVRGVVVVDQSPSDFRWPDWPDGFLDLPALQHVMEAVQTDQRAMARDLVGLMFEQPPAAADAAWMVEEISRPPASVASAILFDQTLRDYRPALAAVDVPSLVVTGRHDKLVPVSAAELVASSMPRAELVVFDESGHCPFLDEPERFNDVLARFVEAQS